jgi:uncharacterized membrane protein YhaH (DUF805 family)
MKSWSSLPEADPVAVSSAPSLRAPPASFLELIFASSGRIGRLVFWGTMMYLSLLIYGYYRWLPAPVVAWTDWLVTFLVIYVRISVVAKRLHDLGRSGWWAAFVIPLSIVFHSPVPHSVRIGVMILELIPSLYLIFAKGQPGRNRFGPPAG